MTRTKNSSLIEVILQRSYREGDFTLASGQKSSFYIDLKATTLSAEGARAVGQAICFLLQTQGLASRIEAVGGLTLGADPIATAVSMTSLEEPFRGLRPQGYSAFIVRKDAKGHGTTKKIEGLDSVAIGSEVVVLEDVSTTGASAWQAVEAVRAAGFKVAAVVTVVDREQGAGEFFEKQGVLFLSVLKISEIKSLYRA
jgi:orotate phosphoribosyltransferase